MGGRSPSKRESAGRFSSLLGSFLGIGEVEAKEGVQGDKDTSKPDRINVDEAFGGTPGKYRVGGGVETNVGVGTINTVGQINFKINDF
jgi:hypothetical protein